MANTPQGMKTHELVQRFDKSLAESAHWELLDKVLIDLCKAYPTHESVEHVSAKVALIGRTYVTGIERAFRGGLGQGDALSKVIHHMHRNAEVIDSILAGLASNSDALTEGAIEPIVRGHSKFLNQLRECGDCHRSPRSFVSKYLHFHRPIVPIYDSYVVAVIPKIVGRRVPVRDYPAGIDIDYASYIEKFWRVSQRIRDAGRNCTVKQVDTYLLWEAHDPPTPG